MRRFVAATAASETRYSQQTSVTWVRSDFQTAANALTELGGSALLSAMAIQPAAVVLPDRCLWLARRLAYGELPTAARSQRTIPRRSHADVGALPQAEFVQDFHDVMAGYFIGLDELPRVNTVPTQGLPSQIHVTWGHLS